MERFSALLLGIYILLFAFIDRSQSEQSCPSPDFPEEGDYFPKLEKFQLGDTITYNCSKGYTLVGKDTSRCKTDGDWSDPTPFCDPKTTLTNPYARLINGAQRQTPQLIDADQNTCFSWKKSETIWVNLDKKNVVYSVRLFLGKGATKIEVSTGRTKCGDYSNNLGTSQWVNVICKNDEETSFITFQDKSDNNNISDVCEVEVYVKQADGCEKPPRKNTNGYYKVSRSRAELICEEGYRSNATRLACEGNEWKPHWLSCSEILCNPLNITRPPGGNWIFLDAVEKISAGTRRQLKCDNGHKKTGYPDIVKCQKNGFWTKSNATCIEKKKPKVDTQTIIYASVGAVAALIIIALLAATIYFLRKQRDRQLVVIYKSPNDGSVISGSEGESAAAYYETIQYNTPVPPTSSRPLPQILPDGYTLPLDGKDTLKKNTMPADLNFSAFKQSLIYN